MVLLHLRVALSLYVILKRASHNLRAPNDYCLLFKGEHLEQARTSWLST
jgi:hypothetical protein